MAIVYRDYGYKQGSSAPNNAVNVTRHSQVYTATHDGAGNRLPYMNRSFISFTWGEKCIEDFNLLAIIENNSLQRRLYAEFEDTSTITLPLFIRFENSSFTYTVPSALTRINCSGFAIAGDNPAA